MRKLHDGKVIVYKKVYPYNNIIQIIHVKENYYQSLNRFIVTNISGLNEGVGTFMIILYCIPIENFTYLCDRCFIPNQ